MLDISPQEISSLSMVNKGRALLLMQAQENRHAQRLFFEIYPEADTIWTGPSLMGGLIETGQTLHSRHKYPKHMECLAAGVKYRERCAMFGNRTGKTFGVGGYEISCHLTGLYPDWWEGRRFEQPISAWAAGKSYETTRDILQLTLLGEVSLRGGGRKTMDGRGIIPGHLIGRNTWRSGISDVVDRAIIHHVSGGNSFLGFKCHPAGTRVLMSDGSWQEIQDIKLKQQIMGPDGTPRAVTQLHAYVDAPVLRVQTRSGEIMATLNHQMATQRGFVAVGDLVVGDVLEIVGSDYGSEPVDLWRVRLMAMMIGDGCTRGKTPFFSCNEPEIVEMVRETLPDDLHVVPINKTISYKVSSRVPNHNRLTESLRADGLWGRKSVDKFIPAWVFRLPREQRIEFLRWLWGCDGRVTSKDATYASSSIRLINDMRLLLWSVGIHAKVSSHIVSNQSRKKFQAYYIGLHGENRLKFSHIGKLNRDSSCSLKPRPKGPVGEVVALKSAGISNVYCVGVDGIHELIVEGYRVGNSYDQGRKAFEGTGRHVIWFDEEPPMDVYNEALIRTATLHGIIILTFTPLSGLSEVVLSFMPADQRPDIL